MLLWNYEMPVSCNFWVAMHIARQVAKDITLWFHIEFHGVFEFESVIILIPGELKREIIQL